MSTLRAVLWWVAGSVLTLTAGEAEHVRRHALPQPGICIGSSLLLKGLACPAPEHGEDAL